MFGFFRKGTRRFGAAECARPARSGDVARPCCARRSRGRTRLRRTASFPSLRKPQTAWRIFAPAFALTTTTTRRLRDSGSQRLSGQALTERQARRTLIAPRARLSSPPIRTRRRLMAKLTDFIDENLGVLAAIRPGKRIEYDPGKPGRLRLDQW